MNEYSIETYVDGEPHAWKLSGELGVFDPLPVSEAQKVIFERLGADGYKIIPIPASLRASLVSYIQQKITALTGKTLADIGTYHTQLSDEEHTKVIESFRDTRFADFGDAGAKWTKEFGDAIGLTLTLRISALERDHIQIRTVRAGSGDYNPPHRDAYLDYYRDVLNVWVPLNYLGHEAIMPVCPGSHLWDESKVLRTPSKGAKVGSYTYMVPAVVAYRDKLLEMIRPKLGPDDALLLTPYLVHGFGRNPTNSTRFALELRLEIADKP